jgi:hypothetical protein
MTNKKIQSNYTTPGPLSIRPSIIKVKVLRDDRELRDFKPNTLLQTYANKVRILSYRSLVFKLF